ncbi:cation diffusion facilitator family transporter [Adlercreutzia sp. ZJ304]|uniref:cation diffusion facilitator family transporter n=1 Tax=Adlercreutzia sp. ZJ304 TaxID=2709791 RepID=UPI0013EE2D20|nr:cation diffusion facilitator family transporter [Adlercreutzia sp. ZJ304]
MLQTNLLHTNSHARSVARVLAVVFVLNVVVALAKLLWGIMSQSMSMSADGMHSLIDSLGNVVGLIGIFIAGRPADSTHPYGHSKFELFASLVIGCFLIIAAFEVGSGAIERIFSGVYVATITPMSYTVMGITLVVNLCVTTYERKCAKRFSSSILAADAMHTLSDVLTSIGVIVGLVLVQAGFPIADPIMALVVTVFIVISAISVFRSSLRPLSDHSQIPKERILEMAKGIPGVVDVHAVRSRGTEAEVYCDLHLLVDPQMTVLEAHRLGDKLESKLKDAFPSLVEVLVHVEPYGYDDDVL